jgi:alkylation response protein AidB-like acyl-CoA dehydrogenase
VLTTEQQDFRHTLRRFLAEASPESAVREQMATQAGFSPVVWKRMASELGLQALLVPEEHGGLGAGLIDVQVVMEEMGRVLLCAPFLSSSVMATLALVECADAEAQGRLLPALADGELTATLAVTERKGRWAVDDVKTTAQAAGDGTYSLNGEKWFVIDGHTADVLLVAARVDDGVGLFELSGQADGLVREPLVTLDETRKLARLELQGAHARQLSPPQGGDRLARVLQLVAGVVAAEQVGGARRVLEMSVEYATIREQFGRPIGSFQAIKHKCADMLMQIEAAEAAAYAVGRAADQNDDDVELLASVAKSYCSDAYLFAASENIQIHGGIGFTWEHPAHLYYKRAKASQLLLGSPGEHRELILSSLGI